MNTSKLVTCALAILLLAISNFGFSSSKTADAPFWTGKPDATAFEKAMYERQFYREESFEAWNKSRTGLGHSIESREGPILFENFSGPVLKQSIVLPQRIDLSA